MDEQEKHVFTNTLSRDKGHVMMTVAAEATAAGRFVHTSVFCRLTFESEQ
jgi:hypothetical protein